MNDLTRKKQPMCNQTSKNAFFRRILIAVDNSQQALWATEFAGALAQTLNAKVALVHAYRVDPGYSPEMAAPIEDVLAEMKEAGAALLKRQRDLLPREVEIEELLVEGEAATQIVSASQVWRADVIVMGAHGRGRLAQFLMGSTADSVIRMSRCPVLTIAHEPRKHVDANCCRTPGPKATCSKQPEVAAP
jgi:nucleotide-binding universal stress UspA family protein